MIERLKPCESIRLYIHDLDPPATRWRAVPDLVTLEPSEEGRWCLATAGASSAGEVAVRAYAGDRMVGYFGLAIEDRATGPESPRLAE